MNATQKSLEIVRENGFKKMTKEELYQHIKMRNIAARAEDLTDEIHYVHTPQGRKEICYIARAMKDEWFEEFAKRIVKEIGRR